MDATSTLTEARASSVLDRARAEGVAAARSALAAANQRSLRSLERVLALDAMMRAFAPDPEGGTASHVIGVLSPHIEVLTYPARPETDIEDGVRRRLDDPDRDLPLR